MFPFKNQLFEKISVDPDQLLEANLAGPRLQ